MPLVVVINVIDNLDSDSERDALSARMGKVLWAALAQERQERIAADNAEKSARETEDDAIWAKLRNLWFEDIHGKLSGTRVYALEGNEGP